MEQSLTLASLKALEGSAPAPTAEERAKAHRLRQTANDLFQVAMTQMKDRLSAAKRA